MALTLLTTIFFVGGVAAILYSLLALLSMLNHARAQKALPDKYEPVAGKPVPDGPPIAEAFWARAKILLQNQRFNAALIDCRHAIEINPHHAEANSLWKHLVPPEPVPIVPAEEGVHPAAKASQTSEKEEKVVQELGPVKAEPAAPAEPGGEIEIEEAAVEPEPEEAETAVELQAEAEIEPAAPTEPAGKIEAEVTLTRKPPLVDEEEAPLIPEDKLVAPEPQRESLLEEIDHEKLRELEEGEAGKEDAEWTRFADKKGPKLAESKIDMNELPAEAVGLKETLSDLRRAEAYNLQGETNLSKNFYNNAIKDFSRALGINPNYVDALINRGSAYAELGRFNDALMDFNHALKFEKRDAELFNKRGEIYLQNKMYNEAIKDFASALVLNPMFSDAYLNRGRAYAEKGMPEEAMTDFKQAVKADSDHSFSFIDRAAPEVHIAEGRSSNLEEAAKFNQQGSADMQNEKFQAAVDNFTQAINLASSEADGYINRGQAFLKLDKPDEAMADFNEAVLFDPLNASLYYWRAQAWRAQNDQFNIREDLKLSCEMGHEPACLEYRELKSIKK